MGIRLLRKMVRKGRLARERGALAFRHGGPGGGCVPTRLRLAAGHGGFVKPYHNGAGMET
jgi:hypothetical protein